MSTRPRALPAHLTIRFSRSVADRCRRPGAELPDWLVCDAIANGRRERRGRGAWIRCERAYPAAEGQNLPEIRVCVWVEPGRREWVARRILAPRPADQKNSAAGGFLHRPGPK